MYLVHSNGAFCSLQNPTCLSKDKTTKNSHLSQTQLLSLTLGQRVNNCTVEIVYVIAYACFSEGRSHNFHEILKRVRVSKNFYKA